LFMQEGDICDIELEGVGILRNFIADEVAVAAPAVALPA